MATKEPPHLGGITVEECVSMAVEICGQCDHGPGEATGALPIVAALVGVCKALESKPLTGGS